MEADIIATGFRISEEKHGLRYTEVVMVQFSTTYAQQF